MRLRARKDGGDFVLDGEKIYITSAEYAGIFVVWAVTDPEAPRGKGISLFLVPATTPGLTVGKPERKLGQHGSATNAVSFENCRIPASAMMGRENDGFRVAVGELAGGRIGIAALSLGIARAAMDKAKAYAKERRQFGKPIADFQGLQWMIADRETDLEAARLLILSARRPRTAANPTPNRLRWRSCSPRKPRIARRTRRCRSSAAPATSPTPASSGTCAMRASPASTRARRKSSGS